MAQALWSLLADDGQTDISGVTQHITASGPGRCGQALPLAAGWAVSGQDGEGELCV